MGRSFMDLKAHVFIKTSGERILLVHGQFIDGISFDSIFHQLLTEAIPPFFACNEQHFKFLAANPHQADRKFVFVLRNDQMRYLS